MSVFKKASRAKAKARVAFDGPSGSGKTFTGLRLAFTLGKKVAVIDTESGSASKYAGESPDGIPFDFDVIELNEFAPARFTELIKLAGKSGYDVVFIDSLSHAWIGEGGALDLKDRQAGQGGSNSFTAWSKITPMQREMVDAIIRSPIHVICTMRSKTEYVIETDERTKRSTPRKIGLAPVQRDGMEYEFDVYGSLDQTHTLSITKSRCSALADKVVVNPGKMFFQPLVDWLDHVETKPQDQPQFAPVSEESQVDYKAKLVALIVAKGWSDTVVRDRLNRRFGVPSIEALTQEQAGELLQSIESKKAGS